MARKSGFKYPRLTILILIIFLTYFVFTLKDLPFAATITSLGLIGTFIAGFFYAFSFTAFAAVAMLILLGQTENILFMGIVAGIGSVIADLIIFKTARISFSSEFKLLYHEPFMKFLVSPIPKTLRHFLKILVAMLIIASPLPDEAGVALLANGFQLPKPIFSLISFLLNTGGIYLILYAGKIL